MTRTTTLAVCATLLALPAFAQSTQLNSGHLAALDLDGNGAVSRSEFDTFAANAFQTMDANGDRMLSASELDGRFVDASIAELDADGDGSVSRQEFGRRMTQDFAAADRDGNGVLD